MVEVVPDIFHLHLVLCIESIISSQNELNSCDSHVLTILVDYMKRDSISPLKLCFFLTHWNNSVSWHSWLEVILDFVRFLSRMSEASGWDFQFWKQACDSHSSFFSEQILILGNLHGEVFCSMWAWNRWAWLQPINVKKRCWSEIEHRQ